MRIRPIPDSLKEAVFNVLSPSIEGTRVLDICAGTGAVGIEALSRGASWVTFVESWNRAIKALMHNLATCDITSDYAIVRKDALLGLKRLAQAEAQYDLIFFDPPYSSDLYSPVLERLGKGDLLAGKSHVLVMHHTKQVLSEVIGVLQSYRQLKQGENSFSFYKN